MYGAYLQPETLATRAELLRARACMHECAARTVTSARRGHFQLTPPAPVSGVR